MRRQYQFTYISPLACSFAPVSLIYDSVAAGLSSMRQLGVRHFEIETLEEA